MPWHDPVPLIEALSALNTLEVQAGFKLEDE